MREMFEKYLETSSTLQTAIYLLLKELILNENIESCFTENELAKKLNVSRTPVREAMQKLASEGLIEISHGKRAKINFISKEDIRDISLIIGSLQSLSAELCVRRATNEDISELEEIIGLIQFYTKRKNFDKLVHYNSEFHLKICEFSRNKWLYNIMISLLEYTYPYRKNSISRESRINKACDEHTQIYEAIKNKDIENIKEIVKQHVKSAFPV